jgi:hypothetical protein
MKIEVRQGVGSKKKIHATTGLQRSIPVSILSQ